jgi:hypothetical protein
MPTPSIIQLGGVARSRFIEFEPLICANDAAEPSASLTVSTLRLGAAKGSLSGWTQNKITVSGTEYSDYY